MEFLKAHQLNIMLYMSGICGVLVVLTLMTKTLPQKRRHILARFEAAAMFLLIFDRYAYLYRGDGSAVGFWMVRVSNFMVFFLSLYIIHAITLYLFDLFREKKVSAALPKRLYVCEGLYAVGAALLVVSQFTGLYYTFDANNTYQRAPGYTICFCIPLLMMLIQVSLMLQYRKELGHRIVFPLLLNTIVPVFASLLQLLAYGLSLTNMTIVGMAILLYLFVLTNLNETAEQAKNLEIEFYKKEKENEHDMFEQTAEALASAIDAKDKYTHGHSKRVAAYAQQIAREAGKTEEECENIYFAALLHDVGKIGVDESIISKDGKLTDEEFAQIKKHPLYGDQILSQIQKLPYLSIGARYHHERYDGKGYPDRLKGEDIPEIARIIGVADAYDAMTSKRSYRDPIPQDQVREELVKGMGTQFDPQFARIMLHLIDLDTGYHMQERTTGDDSVFKTSLDCESVGRECSVGIPVFDQLMRIRLYSKPMDGFGKDSLPSLILFDSLDGRIHDTDEKKKNLLYLEYGRICFDGHTVCADARRMESKTSARALPPAGSGETEMPANVVRYDIEAVRCNDHIQVKISDAKATRQIITALPDSTRFCYLSITGEHCLIRGIRVERDEAKIGPDAIPRIAEEISYIRDCPQGDIPNVQIDRWRSAASEGIPISRELKLRFHAASLPMARLVWHCPFVCVFSSKDGRVDGEAFREFVLVRLDGENWESNAETENNVLINRTAAFPGWNEWKAAFKKGVDCEVSIHREGNQITVVTENLGVAIKCITTIHDEDQDVYAALTGDECAITDIHVEAE